MCKFLSAIVLNNGDVLHHPALDSHSDLVNYFKLPDQSLDIAHFAKVELVPTDDTWLTPEAWRFTLDEYSEPIWWKDVAEKAEARVRKIAAKMILKDCTHPILTDGCWIVGGTAQIGRVLSGARIVRVQDKATFSDVRGGTFSAVWGGTFSDVSGGTFSAVWGGTFSDVSGGTFSDVRGGTFSAVRGGTFSAVWGGTFSDVSGGTFSAVWGGTKILLNESPSRYLKLDDSAKARVLAAIADAVKP